MGLMNCAFRDPLKNVDVVAGIVLRLFFQAALYVTQASRRTRRFAMCYTKMSIRRATKWLWKHKVKR
jgi:hypothetical protein